MKRSTAAQAALVLVAETLGQHRLDVEAQKLLGAAARRKCR